MLLQKLQGQESFTGESICLKLQRRCRHEIWSQQCSFCSIDRNTIFPFNHPLIQFFKPFFSFFFISLDQNNWTSCQKYHRFHSLGIFMIDRSHLLCSLLKIHHYDQIAGGGVFQVRGRCSVFVMTAVQYNNNQWSSVIYRVLDKRRLF